MMDVVRKHMPTKPPSQTASSGRGSGWSQSGLDPSPCRWHGSGVNREDVDLSRNGKKKKQEKSEKKKDKWKGKKEKRENGKENRIKGKRKKRDNRIIK
jgi:hypothetical protein